MLSTPLVEVRGLGKEGFKDNTDDSFYGRFLYEQVVPKTILSRVQGSQGGLPMGDLTQGEVRLWRKRERIRNG